MFHASASRRSSWSRHRSCRLNLIICTLVGGLPSLAAAQEVIPPVNVPMGVPLNAPTYAAPYYAPGFAYQPENWFEVSAGPWFFDGGDYSYGNTTNVNTGTEFGGYRTWDTEDTGYIIRGRLGVPPDPFSPPRLLDPPALLVTYWEVRENASFFGADDGGIPRLTPGPSLGTALPNFAGFAESVRVKTSVSNLAFDFQTGATIMQSPFSTVKLIGGIGVGSYNEEIRIRNSESSFANNIFGKERHDLESLRIGPVLGLEFISGPPGTYGSLGRWKAGLKARLYYAENELDGKQQVTQPGTGASLSLKVGKDRSTFSPEFIAYLSTEYPISPYVVFLVGVDFHMFVNSPVTRFPELNFNPALGTSTFTTTYGIDTTTMYGGSIFAGFAF